MKMHLIVCLVLTILLTGCTNTIRGAGEDIEAAGKSIQKSTSNYGK